MKDNMGASSATTPCAARDSAIAAHGNQRYGAKPYSAHLEAVVAVLRDFEFVGDWEAAGWLHDAAEDTALTVADIRSSFGDWIANVVGACTGVGHNRRGRNASIYAKVAAFPAAAIVKTADRIANVEAAEPGSGHAQMYWKEAVAFHDNVARLAPEAMRRRLNRAYAAIATLTVRPRRAARLGS